METTNIKTIKFNVYENGKFRDLFEFSKTNRYLEITLNAKPTRTVTPGKYYKLTAIREIQTPDNSRLKEGASKGCFSFDGIYKVRYGDRASRGIFFEFCPYNPNEHKSMFLVKSSEIISLHEVLEIKELPEPFEYIDNRRNEQHTPNINKAV